MNRNETSGTTLDLRRKKRWETTTVLSLVVGYAGYYICRSNFSVAAPLLLETFGPQGWDKSTLGAIASAGVLCYAIGKIFNGVLVDFVGGKKMFLFGMIGSVVATVVLGLGTGVAVFTIAWSANRLIQSMGWGSLVKITSNWFSYRRYGRIMGILSLSFLFGDALARLFLGTLIEQGVGWRGVFFAAALTLAIIAVVDYFTLKDSSVDVGLPEAEVNPLNLYGSDGDATRPPGVWPLLKPFVASSAFWLVAFMSLGLTLIRESFNFWTPTYLVEVGKLDVGTAAQYSLLFPFFGGISVLISGYLSDKFADGRRGVVMVAALAPLVAVLVAMGLFEAKASAVVPLLLVSVSALLMIGPYSFLAGAISLDLGGKQGSSTASGLIDSAGYFGGILSGWGIGTLADWHGWNAVFLALGAVAFFTLLAAVLYWLRHERKVSGSEHVQDAIQQTGR